MEREQLQCRRHLFRHADEWVWLRFGGDAGTYGEQYFRQHYANKYLCQSTALFMERQQLQCRRHLFCDADEFVWLRFGGDAGADGQRHFIEHHPCRYLFEPVTLCMEREQLHRYGRVYGDVDQFGWLRQPEPCWLRHDLASRAANDVQNPKMGLVARYQ